MKKDICLKGLFFSWLGTKFEIHVSIVEEEKKKT